MSATQDLVKAVTPSGVFSRASAGTGKSGGPSGGRAGDAADVGALVVGRVVLACCVPPEQPASSAVARQATAAAVHRRAIRPPLLVHRSAETTQTRSPEPAGPVGGAALR